MILFHASHEQFAPSHLLKLAILAAQAGFDGLHSSDHFRPWSSRQGQSGFSFAWLGAALQATSIPAGVICAPGQRYHPAIVAQAAATLAELFPGRFWLELGSGEAINEHITGGPWPAKAARNERLLECADIIRRLWSGEEVSHHGHVQVERARLYSRPQQPPSIIGAALSAATAGWVGGWADGLVTVNKPLKELEQVVKAFRDGGGHGKPMYLKVQLSFAADDATALEGAMDQWRTNVLPAEMAADLAHIASFEALGATVTPEALKEQVLVSADPTRHTEWLAAYRAMGFDHLILHNVNREQEAFIRAFGQYVLPELNKS